MAIKKQVFVMSVVFNDEDTYAESAMEAVSHSLFNEEGIIEWDSKLKYEEFLSADITDEDMEDWYILNRKIIMKNGNKEHLPQLDIGEVAFCRDTMEYFVGMDNGNEKLFHLEYILTDLYLVPVKEGEVYRKKFKLSPNTVDILRKEYGII